MKRFLLITLALSGISLSLPALEHIDKLLPQVFGSPAAKPLKAVQSLCTYSVMNGEVVVDGVISYTLRSDGDWEIRMKAGDMEITGTTRDGLVFSRTRYSMSRPYMVQKWNYDLRSSETSRQNGEWVSTGRLTLKGAEKSNFRIGMGQAPLDSDFLGFQLAALLAWGSGSFNADFLVKNRGMKVNADFILSKADAALIENLLKESRSFRPGLARVLKPGCLVYTIRLTGVLGAFYGANVYAAFTNEAIPRFLAYWNTSGSEQEGLWVHPAEGQALQDGAAPKALALP